MFVQMLHKLPEHEVHSILRESSAPPLNIVAALPPQQRRVAVATLFPDKSAVSLSGVIRTDRQAAETALWALSTPFRHELSGLNSLDLSHNSIGPQVAMVVMPMLVSLQQLRVLNLADNDLRAEGLKAVMHGLSDAKFLQVPPSFRLLMSTSLTPRTACKVLSAARAPYHALSVTDEMLSAAIMHVPNSLGCRIRSLSSAA
jgi:hypothetical protein